MPVSCAETNYQFRRLLYTEVLVCHHSFLKGDTLLSSDLGLLGLFQPHLQGERWN